MSEYLIPPHVFPAYHVCTPPHADGRWVVGKSTMANQSVHGALWRCPCGQFYYGRETWWDRTSDRSARRMLKRGRS